MFCFYIIQSGHQFLWVEIQMVCRLTEIFLVITFPKRKKYVQYFGLAKPILSNLIWGCSQEVHLYMEVFGVLAGSRGAFVIWYEGKCHAKISEVDSSCVSWWHPKLVSSLGICSAVLTKQHWTVHLMWQWLPSKWHRNRESHNPAAFSLGPNFFCQLWSKNLVDFFSCWMFPLMMRFLHVTF